MNARPALTAAAELLRGVVILLSCFGLAFAPLPAYAGDLNAEVNRMFNDLGTIGNYTAPGAFKGQVHNTYTGGSFYMRSPNKSYQFAALQFPNSRGGCGGIDLFAGSFSHISGQELKNMLKNITAALPGVAFQVALDVLSPLLGGVTKWLQPYMDMVNNKRIGSCETAVTLASSAAESVGFDADEACGKVAVWMGSATDADDGKKQCQRDRTGILSSARRSSDPNIKNLPPLVGNLTWIALKAINTIDDQEREFIMSMVGTYIYPPDGAGGEAIPKMPTLTSANKLLYGDNDAGGGNINITLLRCNNFTDCDVVSEVPYIHTPFLKKVTDMMTSISDHIRSRTEIPNNSPEVGFVNQVSEPVYRMLSIGNSDVSLGMAETLIDQYRGVIAADYAYTFLERNLRVGMGATMKNYKLNKEQRDHMKLLSEHARTMLTALGQEKIAHYAKVTKFSAIASTLEMLERQLRASMPQNVVDMLGYQAAFMTK
ncbi:MAG: conjugal transfer protein TraH [Sterolibacteriaceae bacterium]|uniref:Conjugal transfer protein TraH n=1 Tax=Candidatus Methylophosphatis roskildensis TaxID=2899263 RepID=A0A9D7E2Z7_9PROT|nr:conjugal transfer protein TraH [Candidatus Methylophosphatis roskildensis]MBK7238240.1 conjugal transfer protein TraH [Sterolibacteriaceae bacterium]